MAAGKALRRKLIRLCTCTVLFCTAANAFGLDKVVYQLDWLPGGDKAPIYAGIQQGFFAAQGIEVKISSGKGSTDALTKLATGRADIGSAGLGALMSAKAQQNIPVSAVLSIFTKAPHAFLTTDNAGINSIKDLTGRTIATSPFTSSNVFLPLVLAANGMSEKDVKVIYTDAGALGPMLAAGRVDAIIAWMTDQARYRKQLVKTGKNLTVMPWSESGMDIYGISLVAGDHFLKTRPEVAQRFQAAFLQALQFVIANPKAAAEDVHALVPEVDTDVAYVTILEFNKLADNPISQAEGLGVFNPARLALTWDWVAKAQQLDPQSLDLLSLTAKVNP